MRHLLTLFVIAPFLFVSSSPILDAQGKGGAHPRGPKATATSGPKTATAHGPKTAAQGPKTTATRGPKTTGGPKTTTGGPKTVGATKAKTNDPKSTAPRPSQASARGKNATTTPATTSTSAAGTSTSALPKNPRLVERLRALLPPGTDMTAAATGFKNQGQFVAAVHVSNNLGLSFTELKTRMVDQNMSLGQAIQQLRPDADATTASRRAIEQADDDLATPRPTRRGSR